MDWSSSEITDFLNRALQEDLRGGDLTSEVLAPDPPVLTAEFISKDTGVLAGLPLAVEVFRLIDSQVRANSCLPEGSALSTGTVICQLIGKATSLLAGERTALNILQRLCGIATQTSRYVRHAAPYGIQVLDTRKTTPTLRSIEKYAVRVGGGTNHRFGLYDAVLVKDNHLKLQGDFRSVLDAFQRRGIPPENVEIEVTGLSMLRRAIRAGGRWFLLDNMKPSMIRKCLQYKQPGMRYEVSGGMNPRNFSRYLISGVDAISVGGLTHSVRSLDISMEIQDSMNV